MRERVAELFGLPPEAPHIEQALTHPSYANERRDEADDPGKALKKDNQRLEFLGDAVLGFVTSELLHQRFPTADEGTLTRMRARLVNADALARFAREHGIAGALRVGRGAEVGGLRDRTNVLADAVEALIAAAYLDGGLEVARRACERVVAAELVSLELGAERDPKSELQERVQALGLDAPTYEVVDSGGPAHNRWFEVSARIAGREVARGRGRSKRQAEFAAAADALLGDRWRAPVEEESR